MLEIPKRCLIKSTPRTDPCWSCRKRCTITPKISGRYTNRLQAAGPSCNPLWFAASFCERMHSYTPPHTRTLVLSPTPSLRIARFSEYPTMLVEVGSPPHRYLLKRAYRCGGVPQAALKSTPIADRCWNCRRKCTTTPKISGRCTKRRQAAGPPCNPRWLAATVCTLTHAYTDSHTPFLILLPSPSLLMGRFSAFQSVLAVVGPASKI